MFITLINVFAYERLLNVVNKISAITGVPQVSILTLLDYNGKFKGAIHHFPNSIQINLSIVATGHASFCAFSYRKRPKRDVTDGHCREVCLYFGVSFTLPVLDESCTPSSIILLKIQEKPSYVIVQFLKREYTTHLNTLEA